LNDLISLMGWPAAACLVLVTIHSYLGMHVLARGVIFVDLALAQIAALGSTIALLMGHDLHSPQAWAWALGATFAGAAVFAVSRVRYKGVPQEAIIGVTYAVASSAAILIVDRAPHGAEHIKALLIGAILWVTPAQVLKTLLIYSAVGLFHWIYRKRFLLISQDHDRAEAEGINVRWWDFLFYASFGFVVTSSVEIAGVLLVFSFLIVPAIIGVLFGNTAQSRLMIGWIVGWIVSIIGCVISYQADLPTGATVVCTFGIGLAVATAVRRLADA
jgi:zinc/manganese transport system permease protein